MIMNTESGSHPSLGGTDEIMSTDKKESSWSNGKGPKGANFI
jgi:hypothetical protein